MSFTGHGMSLGREQPCKCIFVMDRQKCWTDFGYDMPYVGCNFFNRMLGKERMVINCYFICVINQKVQFKSMF